MIVGQFYFHTLKISHLSVQHEFGAVAQLADEWTKRGTKVIGVSVDGVEEHKKWKGDIEKVAGATAAFPIIADGGLEVSNAFDMLPAEAYMP